MNTIEQMREQERSEGYRDINEAILNKLIELGCVNTRGDKSQFYISTEGLPAFKKVFNPCESATDFELVLRALFDECAKQDLEIVIKSGSLYILEEILVSEPRQIIHKGDTSRDSFVKAFCKVTGVSG